ncbi:MAG: hypothetical protein RI986_829 [Planctomycetota bacterium]
MRWMFGLQSLPVDATAVRFAWERRIPTFAWLLVCVLALLVAWGSYRNVAISKGKRRVLCWLRTLTIIFLVALFLGPLLEVPQESVEPDSVIILADRSRSMEVADLSDSLKEPKSRDAALRQLVSSDSPFAQIGSEHRVAWYGFSDALTPLTRANDGSVAIGDAVGDQSLLSRSIEQALSRSSGRQVSAVVLLTDGRTTDPPDRNLIRRLQAEGVTVSSVVLGADVAIGDTAIATVQAPKRAFSKDIVPVEAIIERRGPARARASRVELVDTATGTVLDFAELPAGANMAGEAAPQRDTVQLVASPTTTGDARWEVRVSDSLVANTTTDGQPARDLLPVNNRRAVPITLVDRPMRVLYIDGYPRWEYRYLKNLLQREQTIESSVMLLSADREFAQEGNTPIARLPRTREEFERFDLIVIGDIPATFFTGEQLLEMKRAVAERGTGLAWIGGSRSTPRTWHGTSAEELLPFTGPYELERLSMPVNLSPTPLAARLGVLRLADDPKSAFPAELLSVDEGWAQLEWAQRIPIQSLKPASEILAESAQEIEGGHAPLVVAMRYGAGNVLYVATDEIWRWRNGRGETYPERFWVQLLRSLARPSLGIGREEVRIAIEPGRAVVGDTVRVEVELPAGAPPATVALEAIPEDSRGSAVDIVAMPGLSGLFVAAWSPEREGRWKIRPRDPSLAARAGDGAILEVTRSDRELRDAEADRPLLESLARETGGRVVRPADAAALVRSLPNRSIRTENPLRDPIWNSPLALAILMSLLASEWIIRRSARLI